MATFWAVWGWLPFGLFGSDKVRVDSKINEDEQYIWEFCQCLLHRAERHRDGARGVKRGTKIIFYLKEDQSEFLGVPRSKDLVKELSEFIGFPIVCTWRN